MLYSETCTPTLRRRRAIPAGQSSPPSQSRRAQSALASQLVETPEESPVDGCLETVSGR